ncbi:hypothetical protein C8T65DRAFT_658952 [Cerioporus squamosus]|nr:hypothetical protein C8T65DRAFT_658952 [Cerioporus squamosus]
MSPACSSSSFPIQVGECGPRIGPSPMMVASTRSARPTGMSNNHIRTTCMPRTYPRMTHLPVAAHQNPSGGQDA